MSKVDLRARVDGFLEKRLFTEGADVKEGDLLFVIEKGLYQAAVDEAKAGVEKAEATLKLADIEFNRQSELVQTQRRRAGAARRGHRQAGRGARQRCWRRRPRWNGRSSISATPTSARRSPAASAAPTSSVGNFVGPSSGALATIVSQDPIYVGFPVTQREILAYRKEQAAIPPRWWSICSSPTAAATRSPARSTSSTSR